MAPFGEGRKKTGINAKPRMPPGDGNPAADAAILAADARDWPSVRAILARCEGKARNPTSVRSGIRSRSISAAIAATMNSILSATLGPLGRCSPAQIPGKDLQADVAGLKLVLQ